MIKMYMYLEIQNILLQDRINFYQELQVNEDSQHPIDAYVKR